MGVHMSPGHSGGLCRGRSPHPAAGLQEVCGQRENGMAAMSDLFLIGHQERSTGRKGRTNLRLIHDAPRTHPRLCYTVHVCTSPSHFHAAAAGQGPSSTAATIPLLSLSRTAWGEGTTPQCHQPSRPHGVCHVHHTPAKTHRGYKLDRPSDCGAFCSSLHLWTISPPLKCFTLFITFHLTPATSSK